MIQGYIGKWNHNRLMNPNEFITNRNIEGINIKLPNPPKQDKILNYNLPIKRQKWIVPIILSDKELRDLPTEERIEYIRREVDRRNNGIFFYNHGGIEYITGIHYFYLTYWKCEGIGLPDFRDCDRDFHYCWDASVSNIDCYGLAFFCNRRQGKTQLATNILYESASSTKEVHCGIQSQTNKDAKNVFRKVVFSWKKMPYFWKPVDSGDKNPAEKLRFEEPSIRSTKGVEKTYKNVLDSIIDYASSTETAYDGYKLYRYYCDEFGKFTEGNAYDRWNIVKPCLRVGMKIIGKSIFTTTVEELEKGGGQAAYDIYLDSDPCDLQADGRTKSGLWRLFKPAYYGLEGFIDEYGYSDINGAKKALLAERQTLQGKDLAALTRKYPFNPKEAFQSATGSNVFPTFKIIQQKDYNISNNILTRSGNFLWEDRDKYKVRFVDDPNGKFEISYIPEESDRNKFEMVHGLPSPLNKNKIFSGVDPFDHRTTVDVNRYSKGAMAGFRKFDPMNPNNSNSFFLKYLERPPKETIFYEDVIMASVFFGMQFLPENQKPGIINYAVDNGFKNYVMKTQQGDYTKSNSRNWVYGVSTSGEMVREIMIGNVEEYIYDFIGKISPDIQRSKFGIAEKDINLDMHGVCPFIDILDDWEKFDSSKWTIYDMTVATLLTKLAATPVRNKNRDTEETKKKFTFDSFFNKYQL